MCRLFFCGITLGCLVLGLQAGTAEEPTRVLNALRDRGEFQKALEYLDSAATDAAVSKEFEETLEFERGMTLLLGSKKQKDASVRSDWLADGQKAMQSFLAEHPESPQAIAALQQLGNAFVEQARELNKRAELAAKLAAGDAQSKMLTDSNEHYAQALAAFEKIETIIAERMKGFPAVVQDPKKMEERDRLRKDLLQALLLQAATVEESAETQPKGSAEQTKTLSLAAERYGQIHKKYRTRLAGLYARLYQARCQQKLGKHLEALVIFDELLAGPDAPDVFHTFRVKTVFLTVDSWMEVKQYQRILDTSGPILAAASEVEGKMDEFIDLRVKAALAAKALADERKK